MKRTLAVSLMLGLSACGGGYGGSSGPMGPSSVDFGAAIANLVNNGLNGGLAVNVSLNGSVTGSPITGTGTYTLSPAVGATFPPVSGAAALSQALNTAFNVSAGGTMFSVVASVDDFYAMGNYAFLGEQATSQSSSNEFDIANPQFTYPTTVKVGDTAVLGTVLRYSDSTRSSVLGSIAVSYLVKADTANYSALIVELISQIYDASATPVLLETDKTDYAITSSGAITLVSAMTQQGTNTLTVTAQ